MGSRQRKGNRACSTTSFRYIRKRTRSASQRGARMPRAGMSHLRTCTGYEKSPDFHSSAKWRHGIARYPLAPNYSSKKAKRGFDSMSRTSRHPDNHLSSISASAAWEAVSLRKLKMIEPVSKSYRGFTISTYEVDMLPSEAWSFIIL